jgi:hypothetical protein
LPASGKISDILSRTDLTRLDKLLTILAVAETPLPVSQIRDRATQAGLRDARRWNISQILSNAKELAIRINEGWTLTARGTEYAATKDLMPKAVPKTVVVDLRKHLPSITNKDTRTFLEEAIESFEYQLYRSAVVLSWVGAMAVLYDHVIQNHLTDFNKEAGRRDPKWRNAKTADDLARMKEHDFLDVLESLAIIGKNAKQDLQNNGLKLRNACGHANTFAVGQNMVAAHLERLILNVFSKFV